MQSTRENKKDALKNKPKSKCCNIQRDGAMAVWCVLLMSVKGALFVSRLTPVILSKQKCAGKGQGYQKNMAEEQHGGHGSSIPIGHNPNTSRTRKIILALSFLHPSLSLYPLNNCFVH